MFSVVIPVFNDTAGLIKCISAIQSQSISASRYEIIVADNNQISEKEFILSQLENKKINIIHETRPGSYIARNTGAKFAKFDILVFVDSDCIPDRNWLKNAETYINSRNRNIFGILTGPVELFFKNENKMNSAEIYEKYTGFNFKSYVSEGTCGAGNWISYKDIFNSYGGFNEILKSNGDTELSRKIGYTYDIVYCDDIIVRHPARRRISHIVARYRRIIGGVYDRKYSNNRFQFSIFIAKYIFGKGKFALKKISTVHPRESIAITKVSLLISIGVFFEFLRLVQGNDSKR